MDPLSVTASVIAIIQAINKTISVCLSFRAALKEAPSGLTQVIDETRGLRDILEALQRTIDIGTDTVPNNSRNAACNQIWELIRDIIPQCEAVLVDLNEQLGNPNPSTSISIGKRDKLTAAVRWRWVEPQVKSSFERLERCKSRLIAALSVHQATLLLDVREVTISWQAKLDASSSRIEDKIDAIRAWRSDEDDILKWLSPIPFRATHSEIVEHHQDGTSHWVVTCDEFKHWYENDARILWINGGPGTGKTQVFSQIVEYLRSDTTSHPMLGIIAYTYCDFRAPESLKSSNILGAIISQYCLESGSVPDVLRAAYKSSQSPGYGASRPVSLLVDTITEILQHQKLYILIDGLDESTHAEEIGDLIQTIRSEDEHSNAKILVAGRPTEMLEKAFGSELQLRLTDHKKELSEDIDIYLKRQLELDKRLQWLHPETKQYILQTLTTDSNSMFRWVQCQLDAISPLRSVKAIRQALHQLPADLENTYRRIISTTPRPAWDTMRSALEWLCFSFEPLSLSELHEVLAIERGAARIDEEARLCSPMDILALGNSLFELSSSGKICLAHLSVRDYLLSTECQSDPVVDHFRFTAEMSHRNLALISLTYILLDDLQEGPAQTLESYLERLNRFPFLKAAASAWPYHAKAVLSPDPTEDHDASNSANEELSRVIIELFSTERRGNFMAWVQVLNATYNFKWDIYPRHATAIYYAASFGLDTIVQKLISSAEFNTRDLNAPGSRYGGTPIHAAAYREHAATVRVLLGAGADASRSDFNGVTPLHSAASTGDLAVIRMLLTDPSLDGATNVTDHQGETPYDWARLAGRAEATELLSHYLPEDAVSIQETTQAFVDRDRQRMPSSDPGPSWLEAEIERPVSPQRHLGPSARHLPLTYYFPDFYGKRSGMDSSIVVRVSKGSGDDESEESTAAAPD